MTHPPPAQERLCREAFEKEFTRQFPSIELSRVDESQPFGGLYINSKARHCWQFWQTAWQPRASDRPEKGEVVVRIMEQTKVYLRSLPVDGKYTQEACQYAAQIEQVLSSCKAQSPAAAEGVGENPEPELSKNPSGWGHE